MFKKKLKKSPQKDWTTHSSLVYSTKQTNSATRQCVAEPF
jgi:hypothetical protein